MTLRSLAATAACVCTLVLAQFSPSFADGMPDDEDDNFNPVPSVPAVPAPGVTQPPPVRSNGKPAAPKPMAQPVKPVTPKVEPSPAPVAAPIAPPEPAPAVVAPVAPPATPAAPVTTITPVTVQPAVPSAPLSAPSTEGPKEPEPAPTAAPTPAAPKSTAKPASGQATIYEVLTIDVAILKKNPVAAQITVKGTARTGGWSKVELMPLQSVSPETGMRSFTLVGQPPSGFATQALTPVSATFTIDPLPDDVKTIRVLSETNEIAQTFR